MNEVIANIKKPLVAVKWLELKRTQTDSQYGSQCPFCENGILLFCRHPKTLALESRDHCITCGRGVIYTDIEEVREKLENGFGHTI